MWNIPPGVLCDTLHDTKQMLVRVPGSDGARNGNAKLNARQVRQIRKLYVTGDETCRSLAEKFEVGRQTVHNIVERVIWRRCGLVCRLGVL